LKHKNKETGEIGDAILIKHKFLVLLILMFRLIVFNATFNNISCIKDTLYFDFFLKDLFSTQKIRI
jgi:hypothetical protein